MMGVNTINFLPSKTKITQVSEYLEILGFRKVTNTHLYHYEENNLERVTEIVADVVLDESNLKVELSTTIWRSILDHEIHNFTIKQLKLRFDGTFQTPNGKNRYIIYDNLARRKAEAACYLAYFHLTNNLSRINYYANKVRNDFGAPSKRNIKHFHPESVHTTIGEPFLVSILEDYLRSTYIGLLTYSDKKKDIFKSARISNELLYDVTIKETTIEKVIAHSKSFQNITQINLNFKEIDSKINFIDLLNRSDPKKRYLEQLTELIEIRHKIIHEAIKLENYSIDHFRHHIDLITEIIKIFHLHLHKLYGWQDLDL